MRKEISSPGELMEVINAFRTSRILLTGYELGVFTLIHGGTRTAAGIAEEIHADRRATERLLNALVAAGVLAKKDDLFANTLFSERFLVKGSKEYLGGLAHSISLWNTWSTLTEAVITGTSVAMQQPINDRSGDWLGSFIAAMHSRGIHQAREIADLIDLHRVKKMLDVGGGSGAFAFEFVRRNPEIKAVILDLPSVIPITRKYIEAEGMENSVETLEGDYMEAAFGSGFDLVYLSAVIHINSPEENLLLIKKSAGALNPGGSVVIMDHIMSEDRTEPGMGAIFALNMLVGTKHGDTYTAAEITGWMKEAGLEHIRKNCSPQGTCIMSGTKP